MAVPNDELFIASTYYESMRDNFEGYAWEHDPSDPSSSHVNQEKTQQLAALKSEFETLDPYGITPPRLGMLFKIELALVWLIPATALRARFWTIEDRFYRVVPKSVARSYRQTLVCEPNCTVSDAVLRQRARNLLDTIHANYLINLAREQLIRRLMLILAGAASIIIAAGVLGVLFLPTEVLQAAVVVIVTGMAGAMISIIQRLQKATSRDAMVDDGIFELIGLRIGWVSILMSVAIGGVFAVFIYVLIAGGLLDQVIPKMADTGSQPVREPAEEVMGCVPGEGRDCDYWANKMYLALGLGSRTDLFKLLVYAFASGFAERFVPDIITKLTKDVLPGAPAANGNVGGGNNPGNTGGNGGGGGDNGFANGAAAHDGANSDPAGDREPGDIPGEDEPDDVALDEVLPDSDPVGDDKAGDIPDEDRPDDAATDEVLPDSEPAVGNGDGDKDSSGGNEQAVGTNNPSQ